MTVKPIIKENYGLDFPIFFFRFIIKVSLSLSLSTVPNIFSSIIFAFFAFFFFDRWREEKSMTQNVQLHVTIFCNNFHVFVVITK